MKKIYKTPQVDIHSLTLSAMVCNSVTMPLDGGNAAENGITSADSRSCHNNIWGDDEEDY